MVSEDVGSGQTYAILYGRTAYTAGSTINHNPFTEPDKMNPGSTGPCRVTEIKKTGHEVFSVRLLQEQDNKGRQHYVDQSDLHGDVIGDNTDTLLRIKIITIK